MKKIPTKGPQILNDVLWNEIHQLNLRSYCHFTLYVFFFFLRIKYSRGAPTVKIFLKIKEQKTVQEEIWTKPAHQSPRWAEGLSKGVYTKKKSRSFETIIESAWSLASSPKSIFQELKEGWPLSKMRLFLLLPDLPRRNDKDLHEEWVLELLFCLCQHLKEVCCKIPVYTQVLTTSLACYLKEAYEVHYT